MAPDRGVFLPYTWRMRTEVCQFISEGIYEGRLQPHPSTAGRSLRLDPSITEHVHRDTGLVYLPVEHEDYSYECPPEAQAIRAIITELCRQTLVLPGEPPRALTFEDILVVAPYNLQVRAIQSLIPGVRVGTVDKFQGQQAPVAIYSMTSSEGDASPRGVGFLFSRNRLNVAISRAQILAILVASPKLVRHVAQLWNECGS